MSRIIAGAARGRALDVPSGRDTRPTSSRAREGLFSTLESLLGPFDGLRVLDLYAGSGAVGLEALSRGAVHALLVESGRRAAGAVASNIDRVGLLGAELRSAPVVEVLTRGPDAEPYDVAFLDPPYTTAADDVAEVLALLVERRWLAAGAVVAVERPTRGQAVAWPAGLEPLRQRRYGEATLWYGRATSGEG